jgi:enoyl-CoA hydratase
VSGVARERLGDVEVLRLDRPRSRNAMDTALLDAVLAALGELRDDEALRALVFSTTDVAALSAGADVREDLDRDGGVRRMERFTALYDAIEAFPAPTIAVCVGNCVGAGAELAAGCDLRVGGDNLKLMWAGARMGAPVGPARLVPLVGLSRAKELVLTGRVVGMEEAAAIGFLHRTAPAAGAEAVALALAGEVAAHDPAGVRALKAMFSALEAMPARIAHENELLVAWQREGSGLPSGGVRR